MNDHPQFPALEPRHLSDARVYADRRYMIEALGTSACGAVAEIGVALGDFSESLINVFKPHTFVAFDVFHIHSQQELWGRPTSEIFNGLTHAEYYRSRMSNFANTRVIVEEGTSRDCLPRYEDKYFDLIYVDASHTYTDVAADAAECMRLIKDTGVLIFNDYIMYDHVLHAPYGVVPAVNELLVKHGDWKVIGFALQKDLFCDIALAKRP
jgi:hypothetical protein